MRYNTAVSMGEWFPPQGRHLLVGVDIELVLPLVDAVHGTHVHAGA
jgi:hypothetical protein